MLSKELIDRLISFIKRLPLRSDYLEKYLRKLKSEGVVRGYRVVGISRHVEGMSFDVCEQDDYYRVFLAYRNSVLAFADIVNHNDSADNQHVEI